MRLKGEGVLKGVWLGVDVVEDLNGYLRELASHEKPVHVAGGLAILSKLVEHQHRVFDEYETPATVAPLHR